MGLSTEERAALVSESLELAAALTKAAAGGLSVVEIIALAPKLIGFLGRLIRDVKSKE